MKRLLLYKNSTNFKEYTVRLIESLLGPALVDDPAQADYVLVSICDITELDDILSAKKYGKPVVTGGLIADYPIVNELSDYTWHGEIYGFASRFLAGEDILDMPSISTKDNKRLVIDQNIKWLSNPIVRVGKRAMYYYVSKGCPVKCKYCYISHNRTYQKVPQQLYRNALQRAGKDIMPIAAYNPYGVPGSAHIGETLLREYITGNVGRSARLLRMGVEFVTDELSKSLAKGVTLGHVNVALGLAKQNETKLILYYIAGCENQSDIESYFSGLAVDYDTKPVVTIVFTYIDPQPFTPFQDFDLRQKITNINAKEIFRFANAMNKRVRVMPLAKPEVSLTRTLLARSISAADYLLVKSLRNKTSDEILSRVPSRMIGSQSLNDVINNRRHDKYIPDYWADACSTGRSKEH